MPTATDLLQVAHHCGVLAARLRGRAELLMRSDPAESCALAGPYLDAVRARLAGIAQSLECCAEHLLQVALRCRVAAERSA